jgi:alpha-galactosidase
VRIGGCVENLPADACVEVACLADARSGTDRCRPRAWQLNNGQIASQRLTVEAATSGDRDLVHAAVALDPLMASVVPLPRIHEMADRMIAAEAPWLPQFASR